MHKHFSTWVVAAAIVLTAAFIYHASALSTSTWFTSSLTFQRQADTTSLSTTASGYGNIDCTNEDPNNCVFPTTYGEGSSGGTVRLNSSNLFVPVISYLDSRQRIFPVPHSDIGITYYSGPVFGLNVAFNYDIPNSVVPTNIDYVLAKPPDGKLMDKAKHLLAGDPSSVSFSENGRYMIVSIPNTAIARVDLQTFNVLPFAQGFTYGIGLDPAAKTTITNDGRYAVVASFNFSTFKIYDLSTCTAVPDTISAAVSCQSRDLKTLLQTSLPGFSFISQVRFMNNDTLAAYAVYKVGTTNKIARLIISDNGGIHQQDLLSLGDSYISGEGAFNYESGTDTNTNKCHVSLLSYTFLAGKDLNYNSYHSVACSGAVTNDITDTKDTYSGQTIDQIKRSDMSAVQTDSILVNFNPGYIDQLDFIKTYQPQSVLVSVGGNDMGFSDILKTCVDPRNLSTCYSTYEDRLLLVRQIENNVFPRLVQTYKQIKNAGPPDIRLYVIGYPQIAKSGGDCGLNVHLNADELLFSRQLIGYLDTAIQTAAAKAGVYYVDTQDALNGHRLCEAGPGSIAMNGLTAGNDRPSKLGGPIGDESYHPNDFGYQLLENKILSATRNLTNPMPAANSSSALPKESTLEILNRSPSGQPVYSPHYDPNIASDLAYVDQPTDVNIIGSTIGLPASTRLSAELHSTPIALGNFISDAKGNLFSQITIPATVPSGYHTLHLYGNNLLGQTIDIYKTIYIAASPTDIDGNGISDDAQKCVGVPAANQDFDQDGIDDACDANITQPPPTPARSSQATSGTDLTASSSPSSSGALTTPAKNKTTTSVQAVSYDNQTEQLAPSVLGLSSQQPQKVIDANTSNNSPRIISWSYIFLAIPILIIVWAIVLL